MALLKLQVYNIELQADTSCLTIFTGQQYL